MSDLIDTLCLELGLSMKSRARLAKKHGDGFQKWLEDTAAWVRRQDADHFLARQNGLIHPEQYCGSEHGAIQDGGVAVPVWYQNELSVVARNRFAQDRDRERTRQEFRAVTSTIKDTAVKLERAGGDALAFMADIRRVVDKYRDAA